MKTLTLLVGLPGSGKSTWRKANVAKGTVVISSDDLLDIIAIDHGITYNEAFKSSIEQVSGLTILMFQAAVDVGVDIFVDRTNLTPKSRGQWVRAGQAAGYTINAIVFARPMSREAHDEWNRRLVRPGKVVPDNVLREMFLTFKEPTVVEGFTTITHIDTFKDYNGK